MKEKLKKEQRETKRKQANGITLIALVITIIVLLILAGVSIAMLTGQNGILSQAQNAKKQTEQASENENKDMDKTIAIINDYTGSTLGKNQIDKNRTLSGAENGYTYKNPVIPKGFRAVNDGAAWYYTDDESTEVKGWNDGLVIEDEKGNQFVWVPVDGTNVTYAKRDFSDNLNSYKTYVDAYPDGIDTEQEEIDLIEKYGGFYIGRFEAGLERDSN